jgi:hypothetical protein
MLRKRVTLHVTWMSHLNGCSWVFRSLCVLFYLWRLFCSLFVDPITKNACQVFVKISSAEHCRGSILHLRSGSPRGQSSSKPHGSLDGWFMRTEEGSADSPAGACILLLARLWDDWPPNAIRRSVTAVATRAKSFDPLAPNERFANMYWVGFLAGLQSEAALYAQ